MCTLFLLMVPGVLLCRWFMWDRLWGGVGVVGVGFVISAGMFGVLGVPLLLLHLSLGVYLWLIGAVLSAFLVAATLLTLRSSPPVEQEDDPPSDPLAWLLWIPFLLLGATLAFASRLRVPGANEDIWVYLAYVRDFLSSPNLALLEPYFSNHTGLSRSQINGWLLQQAALSRISGIDPVEMVFDYLGPTLIIVALLCFYTLARILLRSESAALLASCFYSLFLLVHLDSSLSTFGGEFVGRIAEDKFVARFLFFPVALGLAYVYLEVGKLRYLLFFGMVCLSMMAVHPVGLAITGLCVGGFGLFHVGLNLRNKGVWGKVGALGGVLLGVVLIPAVVVFVATGESLTAVLSDADINSNDPDVLANMVFLRPGWKHIYELEGGSYIMHPWVVMDPVILGALLVGVPFLVRRLLLRQSMSAQFLLGILSASVIVCYVPPVATFVGDYIVLPGQLWRLAWPIPLGAVLCVGWMAREALGRVEAALGGLGGIGLWVGRFAPLAFVVVLMAAVTPATVAGAEDVYRTDEESMRVERSCFDPIFFWMRDNIEEPSVVLAPDLENTCIPAYSAAANVVSLRGGLILDVLPELERRTDEPINVPQGALDVQAFYSHPTFEEVNWVLRRYDVDYVMVPTKKPRLNEHLGGLPGVIATYSPGQGYALYVVDHRRLDEYLDRR